MEMYCKYNRKHQSHFKYFDKLWRGERRVMLYPNQVLFLCMIHGRLCQFHGTVCFIFSLVCSFLEVLCSSSTTTCKNTFHLWNLLTEWPSFELLHRKNGFFQLQTSVQELLIRVQPVKGFFFLFIQQRTFKETGCSTTSASDLPKIFRYDLLSYKVLFNKGTIQLFHLLNLGIFLYFI